MIELELLPALVAIANAGTPRETGRRRGMTLIFNVQAVRNSMIIIVVSLRALGMSWTSEAARSDKQACDASPRAPGM